MTLGWKHTASLVVFVGLFLLLVLPWVVFADGCAPLQMSTPVGWSDISLSLSTQDGGSIDSEAVATATGMWNACEGLPTFSTTPGGDFTVHVTFVGSSSLYNGDANCNGCGCSDIEYGTNGAPMHAVLELYAMDGNLNDCSGAKGQTLAHEIGHFLGLGHPDPQVTGCSGRIMTGYDPAKTVTSGDCEAPDNVWFVQGEFDHPCQQPPAT